MHQLTRRLASAVEVRVSLPDLQAAVDGMTTDSERRSLHLQRCEWLIQHGGSNCMILLLCCEVSPQDIRQMRQEMKLPVRKGRIPALPLEERLSVLESWRLGGGRGGYLCPLPETCGAVSAIQPLVSCTAPSAVREKQHET